MIFESIRQRRMLRRGLLGSALAAVQSGMVSRDMTKEEVVQAIATHWYADGMPGASEDMPEMSLDEIIAIITSLWPIIELFFKWFGG